MNEELLRRAQARKALNDELVESDEIISVSGDDRIYVMNGRLERLFPKVPPVRALLRALEEPALPPEPPPEVREKPQERAPQPRSAADAPQYQDEL